MERCHNCGRAADAHLRNGRCPLDVHVVIDLKTLLRVGRTGHPRLLKNLLAGTQTGIFTGVEITGINIPPEVTE